MNSRKVKIYQLQPEVLQDLFTEGTRIIKSDGTEYVVERGLPEGAEYRGTTHSYEHNCLNYFFEHESFEEIPEAQMLPIAEPTSFTKTARMLIGGKHNRFSRESFDGNKMVDYLNRAVDELFVDTMEDPSAHKAYVNLVVQLEVNDERAN